MPNLRPVSFCIAVLLLSQCARKEAPAEILDAYPQALAIAVKNPADLLREEALYAVDVRELLAIDSSFNPQAMVIFDGGIELPTQGTDLDGDGEVDRIECLGDFDPGEDKTVTVRFAVSGELRREYHQRTQAELSIKTGGRFEERKYIGGTFTNVNYLRVPDEHTDHSEFIRYEGPGWESDRVGYRFYLDWRNATDIFGKKVPDMVLQNVGQDGYDSYHEMADWGMDILKVGESLGIGSLGMWSASQAERVSQTDSTTCEIVANGPIKSIIRTEYYGWKVGGGIHDVASTLSIEAGSRLTRHDISIRPSPENLCTGLVKHPEAEVLTDPEMDSEWAYLATYGRQSLAEDDLGMAILYRRQDLIELTEDEQSLVVVLRPEEGELTYYFLAAWVQEPDGIRTGAEFAKYLKRQKSELAAPLAVEL